MDIELFKIYWEFLKKNYQDKTHNNTDLKTYFSILKDYSEEDLKIAIKNCLKYQSYFPRIDEIVKYIPEKKEFFWNEEECKIVPLNEEEKQELEELLDEICTITR